MSNYTGNDVYLSLKTALSINLVKPNIKNSECTA